MKTQIKVQLTYEECYTGYQYGDAVAPNVVQHYSDRSEGKDTTKVGSKHAMGKLAEIGVYKIFKSWEFDVPPPDTEIFEKNSSSRDYSADLIVNGINVHVKSIATSYNHSWCEPSWLFQVKDKLLLEKCRDNDIIALCKVNSSLAEIELYALFPVCVAKAYNLFKDPTKRAFIGNKKVIMEKDIEVMPDDLKWLGYYEL